MKILVKFPTKGRVEKFFKVLNKYYTYAQDTDNLSFLVTCDLDDTSMNTPQVKKQFHSYPNLRVVYGNSPYKIHAVNRDLNTSLDFDIILLASDDMIPQVKGYDLIIKNHMQEYFPDTDGVLWYNDGFQGSKLNTLSILGRKYYERFNYIYHPEYRQLWCDNEFMEVSKILGKVQYFDQCIIRHEHPDWGLEKLDDQYRKNVANGNGYWDKNLYLARKSKNFDL